MESDRRFSLMQMYAQNEYRDNVLVNNWYLNRQASPKDNNPYNPPGGNYFLSTYNRIGHDNRALPNSETHDMLRQIYTRQDEIVGDIYERAPYFQFSDGSTIGSRGRELRGTHHMRLRSDGSKSYQVYHTTMQRDYQPIDQQKLTVS